MNRHKSGKIIAILTVVLLVLAACGGSDEPTPAPTAPPEPTATTAPEPTEEPTAAPEATEAPAEAEAEAAETPAEEAAAEAEATETPAKEAAAEAEAEPTEAPAEEAAAEAEAEAPAEGDAGEITVVNERLVTEILGVDDPYLAAVSPTGAQIAWGNTTGRRKDKVFTLCVYTFENADQSCVDAPSEYHSFPYQLAWSPDGSAIAFTENPVQLGDDSDIWLFTVADGAFTNLTDDGVSGSYMSLEPGSYTIDYLPMWNAADGQIYFWRIVPAGDMQFSTGLYRVAAGGGEAELVRDLTESATGQLIWYDNEEFYMDGPSAISPDGSKLAVLLTVYSSVYATTETGLWLIDLSDDQVAPQQIMTYDDFQTALPPFQNLPASPYGLSWTGDSAGVVVLSVSNDTHSPLRIFYYADAASGSITPLVDFSGIPELENLFDPDPETGIPYRYYSPWTASMSPGGGHLLMFNDLADAPGLLTMALPPDGSLPEVNYISQVEYPTMVARSSRAVDGKVLLYSIMFTIEE